MRVDGLSITQIFTIVALIIGLNGCQSPPDNTQTVLPPTLPPTATLQIGIELTTPPPPTVSNFQQAATATPFPTVTVSPTPLIYMVQEGDTVAAIAARQGTTIETITTLNPGLDPNILFVGQALLLPTIEPGLLDIEVVGTAVPFQLEVVDVQLYPNPVGTTWIVGAVKNVGELAVEDVALLVDLKTPSGQTIQSYTTWLEMAVVPTQETAVFAVLAAELPENVSPVVTVVEGLSVNGSGSYYLDLTITDLEWTAKNGRVQGSGQIQNSGADSTSALHLVITFYDQNGILTGFQTQDLMIELAPGAVYPFVFDALPPGGTAVTTQINVLGKKIGS